MTRELLEQYRSLKIEIESLERKIKRLSGQMSEKVGDSVTGSTPENYNSHIITIIGYPDGGIMLRRVLRLETILSNRYARLLNLQIEIEEYIDTVEDSQIRSIIEWRYVDGWNWRKIARALHHPKMDEQYPRRILERHFKKRSEFKLGILE